jgi:putative SOS response-associated peptidase YedK
MCGRYAIFGPHSRHRDELEFLDERFIFAPVYNAAPSLSLPVYRIRKDHGPEIALLRWGLIPYWAKDPKIGYSTINARAEEVEKKPAFREAFKRRRCLVLAAGFYEWKRACDLKLPYFIRLLNEPLFAFAGLYERWRSPEGVSIESFAIITTQANELMAELHKRMPVILPAEHVSTWLDASANDPVKLTAMLKPYPADEMEAHPVSQAVNNAKNEGPVLIERQVA